MGHFRHHIIKAGLEALYLTGAHYALQPFLGGVGAIFMLHHVRPRRSNTFQPNHHLEIAPEFLRKTLTHLRNRGIDIVSLDEMRLRLTERNFGRRFACFTCDDGYRDNRDFALPVMREFGAPFSVYVTSDFAEGTGRLWWIALEMVIARADRIEIEAGGRTIDTTTVTGKCDAFHVLQDRMRGLPTEADVRREMTELCARHGVDEDSISRELCMSWAELKGFAADPLVTIGAHSISHCNLAKQSDAVAGHEMVTSRARIEEALQRPVDHFAYPYGDRHAADTREFDLARSMGFKTAVTTRKGMLFPGDGDNFTALPRVSLNGNYQDVRILPVLTSGAATAMWNGFRRTDAT
ncbi:polysaccharide deacetylase family protein [soil metagenome]